MKTTWNMNIDRIAFPQLDSDMKTDVVIVGGGLVGVLSAYQLAKEGKKVVVLESKQLGNNATLHTTAFLTQVLDTGLDQLSGMFGSKDAKLAWQSHGDAINMIEKIVEDENIDCEFIRCSNYYYASKKGQMKSIEAEFQMAKRMRFPVLLEKNAETLPFPNFGHMEVKNQGKFHAGKFFYGLVQACQDLGVQVFEKSEVIDLSETHPFTAATKRGQVTAEFAIIATYDPFKNPKKTKFKKGMYGSYVFELQIPKGMFPEAIYEDGSNPYYYFRVDSGTTHDRMIIGGEDHREELPVSEDKSFLALDAYVKQLMSGKKYKIVKKWTGPILEPSDGLALIGELKRPNRLVACAFSGNGMTYSAIASQLFADKVMGRANPYTKLYDPKRIPTIKQLWEKGKDYTMELFGGAIKNTIKPA